MDGFRPYDIADPFPFYARARAEAPIFFSAELGYWVISRYEDIQAIFKDPATFSSANTQTPFKPRPAAVQAVFDEAGLTHASGLSGRQPPDHTRLRRFVHKAFTPRRIASLEPEVRALTLQTIDAFAARGRGDLVGELARDLPAHVIFRLLGVPEQDVSRVKTWALSRVQLNFGDVAAEAEQVRHARALVEYWRYCLALVDRSFEAPGDDLPGDLARIHMDGDTSLTREEIAGLVHTQLFAGHETTSSLLGAGLAELLRRPGALAALTPETIPAAVEELLRLVTPVFAWKRVTTRAARVAGVELPAGANLLLLLGSANRDPTVFERPDELDVHRPNARAHLAFGHGIHFCLGASLARLEARVVLEELTARLPELSLVPDQVFDYSANTTFRAPASVLVRWPVLLLALEDCTDVWQVGGKALSLGTMLRAGFPVPGGFAVTTSAFAAGRVPEAEIRAAYAALGGDVPVAVRSSATSEDAADASCAGQYDTYLWVTGADDVLRHVERCWGSMNTSRALAYRRDRQIAEPRMAVVVQRMVPARAAGVAMTLNPSNGDRSKIAVEAAPGVGEAVVSGEVTPDHYLLDKVMLDVVATRPATDCLSAVEVKQIARMAKLVERHYGRPQDIEWAIDATGAAFLLKARPETVWANKPVRTTSCATGLGSLVSTLTNPLAQRRTSGVDADH